MSTEVQKEIELEIAHVLFLDIVGCSKLSVNEQHAGIEELNEIVRLSEQFQKAEAANRILKIPTGDGMALVFYKSPEEPAQCAFDEATIFSKRGSPRSEITATGKSIMSRSTTSRTAQFGISKNGKTCVAI